MILASLIALNLFAVAWAIWIIKGEADDSKGKR